MSKLSFKLRKSLVFKLSATAIASFILLSGANAQVTAIEMREQGLQKLVSSGLLSGTSEYENSVKKAQGFRVSSTSAAMDAQWKISDIKIGSPGEQVNLRDLVYRNNLLENVVGTHNANVEFVSGINTQIRNAKVDYGASTFRTFGTDITSGVAKNSGAFLESAVAKFNDPSYVERSVEEIKFDTMKIMGVMLLDSAKNSVSQAVEAVKTAPTIAKYMVPYWKSGPALKAASDLRKLSQIEAGSKAIEGLSGITSGAFKVVELMTSDGSTADQFGDLLEAFKTFADAIKVSSGSTFAGAAGQSAAVLKGALAAADIVNAVAAIEEIKNAKAAGLLRADEADSATLWLLTDSAFKAVDTTVGLLTLVSKLPGSISGLENVADGFDDLKTIITPFVKPGQNDEIAFLTNRKNEYDLKIEAGFGLVAASANYANQVVTSAAVNISASEIENLRSSPVATSGTRTPNQPRTPPATQPTEVVVTTTAQEDQKLRTPNITAADISSVLVVPDAPTRAGDPVTGVLTVTNTGPGAARNVVAKVTLPSGEVVDVQIGTIQPGQSVAVTVKSFTPYIVGTGLTLAAKWSALVSASSPDPNMLNNQVNARQNIVTAVYVPPAPTPSAFLPSPIAAVASASPIPSIPSLGSPAPGTANMVGGSVLNALSFTAISALTVDSAGNTYGIGFKNDLTRGGAGPVPFRRHPGSDDAYYLSTPVLFKVSAAGIVTKTDLSDAYVDRYFRSSAIGFVNNTVQVFFSTKPVDGGYAMEGTQRSFDPVTLAQTGAYQLFSAADSGFYPIITPQGVVVSSPICAFADPACGAINAQATTAGELLQAAWLGFTSNGLKSSLGSSFGLETGPSDRYRLAGFSKPIVEGGAGVANSGYSYVSWGRWADGPDTLPTNISYLNRNGAWLAGQLTNGADIPVTGAATFNGVALGNATMSASALRSTPIAGMHTANVNFATRSIAGSFINLTSTAVGGPATVWLANANYTASWRAGQNQILGAVTPAANLSATAPGAVAGGFFGPGAAELGGRFIIQKADGTNATGIFTGKR